jgi:hypothetical protein
MSLFLAQQQSEYTLMWALVFLFVLLGALAVGMPRFRRADLLTDKEKKKLAATSGKGQTNKPPAGH